MESYRDARERVVQMDKDCLSGLGRSDVTVQEWLPPKGFHAVIFAAVVITVVAFSRRDWFAPGSQVDAISPAFASFCFAIQPVLVPAMLIIHASEVVYMIRSRLAKHNVNVRTLVWWKWTSTTFVDGIGSFQRCVRSVPAYM